MIRLFDEICCLYPTIRFFPHRRLATLSLALALGVVPTIQIIYTSLLQKKTNTNSSHRYPFWLVGEQTTIAFVLMNRQVTLTMESEMGVYNNYERNHYSLSCCTVCLWGKKSIVVTSQLGYKIQKLIGFVELCCNYVQYEVHLAQ